MLQIYIQSSSVALFFHLIKLLFSSVALLLQLLILRFQSAEFFLMLKCHSRDFFQSLCFVFVCGLLPSKVNNNSLIVTQQIVRCFAVDFRPFFVFVAFGHNRVVLLALNSDAVAFGLGHGRLAFDVADVEVFHSVFV